MRVYIVSCNSEDWYKDKIGRVLNVYQEDEDSYGTVDYGGYIKQSDCMIITEEDEELLDSFINQNKEDKMKGKEAKVELRLVKIIDGELVDKTVFESSIQEVVEDKRIVVAGGTIYKNVYYLEIDGVEEFTGDYPKLKVIDNREELAKLKGTITEIRSLCEFGVITISERDARIAKINEKMQYVNEDIEYIIIWEK